MQALYELGVVNKKDVRPYYPRVRDRDDVAVVRDRRTGVIFLASTAHMSIAHYDDMQDGAYWGGKTRAEALALYAEDDARRAAQFATLVRGKDVVDVGCGTGGFMDRIRSAARSVAGVEPQSGVRRELTALGYTMYRLPGDAPKASADVATLFHVLEHVLEPLTVLREVRSLLRPQGTVIIEVPHARDILLGLDSFKQFSLWSEHLVLHTKESLRAHLEATGFTNIRIEGYQRYPLGNHLGWLLEGKPGGQKRYPALGPLARLYASLLKVFDKTDTLIAYAEA